MKFISIQPGRKFIVEDNSVNSGRFLSQGSKGCISYSNSLLKTNYIKESYIEHVICVISRVGKKGKPRIELSSVPITSTLDPAILNNYSDYSSIYKESPFINIEDTPNNLGSVSNFDFLVWAISYKIYLSALTVFGGNNLQLDSSKSAHKKLSEVYKLKELFNYEPQKALDTVESQEYRNNVLDAYRTVERSLFQLSSYLKDRREKARITALKSLADKYVELGLKDKYGAVVEECLAKNAAL